MTSVHPTFETRIFHKQCKSLALAGYNVTLIAPYRGGSHTVNDGIKLMAVPMPHDRRERITKTIPQVYRAAVRADAEIYHFHDPELMPVGLLLKLHGKKVIYDVHEDYSGNVEKQWIPVALRKPVAYGIKFSEAAVGRACDRVIAATPHIASKFNPAKTRIVQNFPWREEMFAADSTLYQQRDPLVAYVGYLADARGLREMIQAIKVVAADMPAKLVIVGKVIAGAQAQGLGETVSSLIKQTGMVDRAQVTSILAKSRIGLVCYHPTPNYYWGQPTKLLEYMAAGLPVVASDFPFYRQVIKSSDCGLLVDPLKPQEIADAILWLLRNPAVAEEMGRRGREAVLEHYNWEHEAKTLVDTYAEL